jgi:hypothetical protein
MRRKGSGHYGIGFLAGVGCLCAQLRVLVIQPPSVRLLFSPSPRPGGAIRRTSQFEGVFEDVIAAVLLLHERSVEEIVPRLSAAEVEQVIKLGAMREIG